MSVQGNVSPSSNRQQNDAISRKLPSGRSFEAILRAEQWARGISKLKRSEKRQTKPEIATLLKN
jgi:hypothetical protein